MSSNNDSGFKMNLNEYLVTLDKPLGIRFALTSDGKIIVHSLAKGVSISLIVNFSFELFTIPSKILVGLISIIN